MNRLCLNKGFAFPPRTKPVAPPFPAQATDDSHQGAAPPITPAFAFVRRAKEGDIQRPLDTFGDAIGVTLSPAVM